MGKALDYLAKEGLNGLLVDWLKPDDDSSEQRKQRIEALDSFRSEIAWQLRYIDKHGEHNPLFREGAPRKLGDEEDWIQVRGKFTSIQPRKQPNFALKDLILIKA